MSWGDALAVVFTGIAVVFIALILLILVIWVMGKVASVAAAVKAQKNAAPVAEVKAEAPKTAPVEAIAVESQDGLTDEVIAAISAAVHCVLSAEGNQAPFSIKSIKRVKGAQNAWNMAGVLDNTRPF